MAPMKAATQLESEAVSISSTHEALCLFFYSSVELPRNGSYAILAWK